MAGGLGTMPLALLTDDGAPRLPELVSCLATRVEREERDVDTANRILSSAFILLGLRYDKAVARTLFHGVQKMRESSTYQAILDEGRQEGLNRGLNQGRAEGLNQGLMQGRILSRQEDLLEMLQERFGSVPPEVEARIRNADDPDRLRAALRQVFHVADPSQISL